MWIAPGHSRREFKNKDGVIDRVIIEDGNAERRKEIEYYPEEKVAHLMEYVNFGESETFFDEAHSLMLKARDKKMEATPLGEKVIDGRQSHWIPFESQEVQYPAGYLGRCRDFVAGPH